ncbi:MAG: PDZ domain-containing protein, partial [archaeon]|nr:PDZ domain-containing protein [archaeon]
MANSSKDDQKEVKTVEISFPFILIRTKKGLSIIERLGQLKFIKKLGWVLLYMLPIAAAVGFYLILGTVIAFISSASIRGFAGQITPSAYLLLPGINPLIPIFYGWMALIIAMLVHEGMHGVLARSLGLSVKSSGLILFLILPIGAFVDVDEKELKKAKAKDSGRVLAAGPGGNIITAMMALLGLILIVSSIVPIVSGVGVSGVVMDSQAQKKGIMFGDIITRVDGLNVTLQSGLDDALGQYEAGENVRLNLVRDGMILNFTLTMPDGPVVVGVLQDFPAQKAGILVEDIIISLNGSRISSLNELSETLATLKPGDEVTLTVERGEETKDFAMTLASNPKNSSLPYLGVMLATPSESLGIRSVGIVEILDRYRSFGSTSPLIYFLLPTLAPYNIPFSDVMNIFYTSSIGDVFYPLANLFFWIWFININLAIFNALPIYPLDGGQAFKVLLQAVGKNRLSEKKIKWITYGVT